MEASVSRRLLLFPLGFALVAGCADTPDGVHVRSMRLAVPAALADDIAIVEVVVFDDGARCDGFDAEGGRIVDGPHEIPPDGTQILTLSAGDRTFSAVGLDASDVMLARGCASRRLRDGDNVDVTITLEAF
jgi:hypothetical protein